MSGQQLVIGGFAVISIIGGFILSKSGSQKTQEASDMKKRKTRKTIGLVWLGLGVYVLLVLAVGILFGQPEKRAFTVEIVPSRILLFGYSLSSTIVISWVVMAVLILLAIILRITVIPHLQKIPNGIQNLLETAVTGIKSYGDDHVQGVGDNLNAYLFTLALFMVGCALVELFGFRAPTADITMTFALALVTFFLINYYGIKKKKLKGRLKSLSDPTPVVLPLRVISDIALPVSMACRLFGNMLGGMIVMDLLYNALGNGAIGIPSVIGLYFNIFHPLIQAFIFITLTLTFVNEAVE